MSKRPVELVVNRKAYSAEVAARRLLADFLRDDLFLTGTKRGCETGVCGACWVLMDREAEKSCLLLAVQANGHEITTIEGLTVDDHLHPVQQSCVEQGGLQSGYCTPGIGIMAIALLNVNPRST